MVGDSSLGSGHVHDEAQDMEVLKAGLLAQETELRALVEKVDRRFQVLEGHFDETADKLDALQLVPTGVGMKTGGDQEKMLIKANLSTYLYICITVDNLSTVMTQKRRKTSRMPINDLQRVEEGVSMNIKVTVGTLNLR